MNNRMPYNIVYITDKKYFFPTKVSIRTAVENSCGKRANIWVITRDLDETEKNQLNELAHDGVNVKLINDDYSLDEIALDHQYVTKTSLIKFKLADIFKDLDKILYLDGDILLSEGYLSVFDTELDDYYMAAVRDIPAEMIEQRMKKVNNPYYFNSGVMLLNLKKMREDDCCSKMIEYKKNDKDTTYMDQDAINAVLGKNAKSIGPEFNFFPVNSMHFETEQMADFYSIEKEKMVRIMNNPFMYHMAGPLKPWNSLNTPSSKRWINSLNDQELIDCIRLYFSEIHDYEIPSALENLRWRSNVNEDRIEKIENDRVYDYQKLETLEGQVEEIRNIVSSNKMQLENSAKNLFDLNGYDLKPIEKIIVSKMKSFDEYAELDFTSLKNRVKQMDSLKNNPAFRTLESNGSVISKIKVFIKRVVRKMIKFYIEPLAGQQTSFNHQTTEAIRDLLYKVETSYKDLGAYSKSLEKELVLLQKENREIKEKLDLLEKEKNEKRFG